jgi:hypothetical protein
MIISFQYLKAMHNCRTTETQNHLERRWKKSKEALPSEQKTEVGHGSSAK